MPVLARKNLVVGTLFCMADIPKMENALFCTCLQVFPHFRILSVFARAERSSCSCFGAILLWAKRRGLRWPAVLRGATPHTCFYASWLLAHLDALDDFVILLRGQTSEIQARNFEV